MLHAKASGGDAERGLFFDPGQIAQKAPTAGLGGPAKHTSGLVVSIQGRNPIRRAASLLTTSCVTRKASGGDAERGLFFDPGQIAQKAPTAVLGLPAKHTSGLVVSIQGRNPSRRAASLLAPSCGPRKGVRRGRGTRPVFFYLGLVGSAQVLPHLPVSLHPTAGLGVPAKHTSGLVVSIQGRNPSRRAASLLTPSCVPRKGVRRGRRTRPVFFLLGTGGLGTGRPRLPVSVRPWPCLASPPSTIRARCLNPGANTIRRADVASRTVLCSTKRRPAGTPNAARFLTLAKSPKNPYGRAWRPCQAHFRARCLNPGANPSRRADIASRTVLCSSQGRPAGTPNAASLFDPARLPKPLRPGLAAPPSTLPGSLSQSRGGTRADELLHFSHRLVVHAKASGGDADRGLFFFYLGLVGSAQVVPRLPVSLHPRAGLGGPAKHTSGLVVSIQGRNPIRRAASLLTPSCVPRKGVRRRRRTRPVFCPWPNRPKPLRPGLASPPSTLPGSLSQSRGGTRLDQLHHFSQRLVLHAMASGGDAERGLFFAPGQIAQKPLGRAWRPRQAHFRARCLNPGANPSRRAASLLATSCGPRKGVRRGRRTRPVFAPWPNRQKPLGRAWRPRQAHFRARSLNPGAEPDQTSCITSHNVLCYTQRRPAETPNAACFFSTWDWWARHRSSPFAILPNPPGPCLASPPSTLPGS